MFEKTINKKVICNRHYCRNKKYKNKILNPKYVIFTDGIIIESEVNERINTDISQMLKKISIN